MLNKFYYKPKGQNIITEEYIDVFLSSNPELKQFMDVHPINLRPIDLDEFQAMTFWVIGQIIQNTIAHNIINRFRISFDPITPTTILSLGLDGLKEYVPYEKKCLTMLNLAYFFDQGGYIDPNEKSSKELIQHYTQVKGIGPWTVKMMMLYCYGRLDINAFEDLGVRQGLKYLYNLPSVPSINEAKRLTRSWGDLASIGSLLAWQVIK